MKLPVLLMSVALTVLAVLALSASNAQATPPFDFSDAKQPQISWPFATVEFWTEEDDFMVWHHTRVSESTSDIYDLLLGYKSDKTKISGFAIVGASKPAQPGWYNFTLFKGSSRYRVNVRPDGSGSVISFKATPKSSPTGYFKRALYPYRLGNDSHVRCERADNRDE